MKPELTPAEQSELSILSHNLIRRAWGTNALSEITEFRIMAKNNNLEALRFFTKHWVGKVDRESVRAAYNGAVILSVDPMLFVTTEHVEAIQAFHNDAASHLPTRLDVEVTSKFFALVLQHFDRVGFITSIIVDRGIKDPDEINAILTASKEYTAPLTGGVL